DLFEGRPWVLTPTARTAADALASARAVGEPTGASPHVMSPAQHERATAGGDAAPWRGLLATNSAAVAAILDAVGADLATVTAELRHQPDPAAALPATVDALARGNQGVERIPGKHGTAPARYQSVPVVLDDRPGQLA